MTAHHFWHDDRSRRIIERIVVEVELELLAPAHLGNGEEEDLTDMPLLTDLREPLRPVLLGTSLAGALRAAVRRWEHGHFGASSPQRPSTGLHRDSSHLLFGDSADPSGVDSDHQLQSALIVDDARAIESGRIEIRDGVRLNPKTRTADNEGLYNGEYWQAGTTFRVRLELVVSELDDDTIKLKQAFAMALACLHEAKSRGTVTIGARKRRGFGLIEAMNWKFNRFDLTTLNGLAAWLNGDGAISTDFVDIQKALIGTGSLPSQAGREFSLAGEFVIDGSLLIRSGTTQDDLDVDMVHLHSTRRGEQWPVLSATTLAGALRTRCWGIAEFVSGSAGFADEIVSELFGPMLHDAKRRARASRVEIQEAEISGATSGDERLIQSRVSIDRFTGGALDRALFDEQPIFGPRVNNQDVTAALRLTIQQPSDAHIGLFLLALRDLATGDLPVGGEVSVGRGILRLRSILKVTDRDGGQSSVTLMIGPNGETQNAGHRDQLDRYVSALHERGTNWASQGEITSTTQAGAGRP